MTRSEYHALEERMAREWPATVAPEFRPSRRKRWSKTEDKPLSATQDLILGLVREYPQTVSDLIAATGMTQQGVRYALITMKNMGLVDCSGAGKANDPHIWAPASKRIAP
jgi:predicted Rossmann fold nucleotide-binding protein DprA/Smf involved in DNA uptake